MAEKLLESYNPLYDVHLQQYFSLPHMQKHLRSIGLLDSSPQNKGEVYARHRQMIDFMLKNRETQLFKLAELHKKLDAAEKVEIYRRIRSGQSPESYRRSLKPSRSLSRGRRSTAQGGSRVRRFSNSHDDKDIVKTIETENAENSHGSGSNCYARLSANVAKYRYLHKLDDPTLQTYKEQLKRQLDKLERFREVSFGVHSVARHPPPPAQSWFFRRRSLPSLTASAPAQSLQEPLRSIQQQLHRGRQTAPSSRALGESLSSRVSCPPAIRKRRNSIDSNEPRLPPIAPSQARAPKTAPGAKPPLPRLPPANSPKRGTTTSGRGRSAGRGGAEPIRVQRPASQAKDSLPAIAAAGTAVAVGVVAVAAAVEAEDNPPNESTAEVVGETPSSVLSGKATNDEDEERSRGYESGGGETTDSGEHARIRREAAASPPEIVEHLVGEGEASPIPPEDEETEDEDNLPADVPSTPSPPPLGDDIGQEEQFEEVKEATAVSAQDEEEPATLVEEQPAEETPTQERHSFLEGIRQESSEGNREITTEDEGEAREEVDEKKEEIKEQESVRGKREAGFGDYPQEEEFVVEEHKEMVEQEDEETKTHADIQAENGHIEVTDEADVEADSEVGEQPEMEPEVPSIAEAEAPAESPTKEDPAGEVAVPSEPETENLAGVEEAIEEFAEREPENPMEEEPAAKEVADQFEEQIFTEVEQTVEQHTNEELEAEDSVQEEVTGESYPVEETATEEETPMESTELEQEVESLPEHSADQQFEEQHAEDVQENATYVDPATEDQPEAESEDRHFVNIEDEEERQIEEEPAMENIVVVGTEAENIPDVESPTNGVVDEDAKDNLQEEDELKSVTEAHPEADEDKEAEDEEREIVDDEHQEPITESSQIQSGKGSAAEEIQEAEFAGSPKPEDREEIVEERETHTDNTDIQEDEETHPEEAEIDDNVSQHQSEGEIQSAIQAEEVAGEEELEEASSEHFQGHSPREEAATHGVAPLDEDTQQHEPEREVDNGEEAGENGPDQSESFLHEEMHDAAVEENRKDESANAEEDDKENTTETEETPESPVHSFQIASLDTPLATDGSETAEGTEEKGEVAPSPLQEEAPALSPPPESLPSRQEEATGEDRSGSPMSQGSDATSGPDANDEDFTSQPDKVSEEVAEGNANESPTLQSSRSELKEERSEQPAATFI